MHQLLWLYIMVRFSYCSEAALAVPSWQEITAPEHTSTSPKLKTLQSTPRDDFFGFQPTSLALRSLQDGNVQSTTSAELSLNTPFDADNASFGAMFTIYALKDLMVKSLAFYTTLTTSVDTRVYIYTMEGNYQGKEETPEAWTIICNATILANAEGKKTLIPAGDSTFPQVPIRLGSYQSFYVTLEQPAMHYTNGLSNETMGDVLVGNQDLELLIGSAVTEFPFKQVKQPRKFNGGINYKLGIPTSAPTMSPTRTPTRIVQWGVHPKSLVTGFDGQMLGYGAVFTISSFQMDIKVQTLEFNSAASGLVDVQVYRRAGNFDKEKMATKELWTLVSDTSVTSAGPGKGTVIPEANFEPFRVANGRNHTIYVTLTSKDLLYTDSSTTNSVGSVYTSDNFLKFYVGQGVSQPFLSTVYDNRVFNGALHYVTEIGTSTAVPTPMPISPWIDAFQIDRVLTTDLMGGTGGYGCMFEIRAKTDLVLRSLALVVNNETSMNVEIWTKTNSYLGFEADEKSWRKVSEVAVQGRGNGNVTQIPSENFEGIAISAGSLQSLYVTLLSPELVYTNRDTISRGDVFQSDENIEICAGSGVGGYKFVNDTYFPRLFNGAIRYSILSTPAPTPAPLAAHVDQKTNNGVVVTQNLIQIAGVPDGQLSADALGYFQGATGNFLSEAIKSSGVKITNVIVSPNMNLDSVHERWLGFRIREPNDSTGNETSGFYTQMPAVNGTDMQNDANSTYNSSEGLAKPQRNLGLYTSIAGEYRPPPFIDFTTLVQNSFDDKGEVSTTKLIEDLKQDASFKNASAVTAKTVKFPLPPEILSLMEPEGLSQTTLYIIYGTCGLVVLVAAIVLVAMWCRNRRKWRSIQSKDDGIDCDDVGDKGYEYARKEPEILNSTAGFYYSQSYRASKPSYHSALYKPKPELPAQ